MQQPMEAYLPYLFSLALQKSGNFADAEDLTQDVLLAAYTQLQSGRPIEHAPSWLSGTLNHKYYDMLRKKYQLPTISIDAVPEPPVCENTPPDRPSDEQVRQGIAYLSKRYREVIVRHYLLGEKVDAIAKSLRIPKGTVLSRLATGRAQLRKGMEQMEVQAYEKLSHTPERLELSCHGRPGLKEEPYSLVANDLMKQNILILAYETPLTAVELARALGIPAPYVESAVDDLVGAELMRRIGNRVCTDFLITQPQDLLKNLEHEIAFTEQHYSSLWGILSQAIHAVNTLPWVKALEDCQRTILEYFYILHILSSGLYTATTRLIPSQETYPPRPDGGAWIAVGSRYPLDFDFASYKVGKYCYGGERRAYYENFLGARSIELHVYDTQPDLNKYEHAPVEIHDDTLCKLLYLLDRGIPFDAAVCDPLFLQDIPHLAACGVLRLENGTPRVAIPVIAKAEYEEMDQLRLQAMRELADWIEEPLRRFLPGCKLEIPRHLTGRVAAFRQYPFYAMPMALVKKAVANGDFLQNVAYPTPPMVLVVEPGDGAGR